MLIYNVRGQGDPRRSLDPELFPLRHDLLLVADAAIRAGIGRCRAQRTNGIVAPLGHRDGGPRPPAATGGLDRRTEVGVDRFGA
jgi:hypothetical protein